MTCTVLGHNSAACTLANCGDEARALFRQMGQGDEYQAVGAIYDSLRAAKYSDLMALRLLEALGFIADMIVMAGKVLFDRFGHRLSDEGMADLLCFFIDRMKHGRDRLCASELMGRV